METQWLPVSLVVWITALAGTLDARQQVRFVALCTGLLFARGRRTVASWLRACGAGRDYKRYYYLLGSVGRKALASAGALLRILLKRLAGHGPGTPLVFGIDDSPTKRYGPHVEGAGKHHNPTPGPAGSKFLYGHVWVCLARLVRHPLWGAIALPIVSHLYIRAKDVGWMAAYYGWQFHTKLELAAAQIEWPRPTLRCSEGGGLVTETGRRSNRRAWTARNTCKLPQAPRQSLSGPRRPIRKATGPEPDFLSEVRVRFLVSGPGRATISLSNSRAPSSVIHENYRPG